MENMDERKLKMIELLIEGRHKKTEIAKLIGVSRTAIYSWMEEAEVKAELYKRLQEIRTDATNRITAQIEPVIDELFRIALNGKNERERKDASIYLCNRVLGSPRSNVDIKTNDDAQEENIDVLSAYNELMQRLDKEENIDVDNFAPVIDLPLTGNKKTKNKKIDKAAISG